MENSFVQNCGGGGGWEKKEIKKLWNFSGNLFSRKFHVGKFFLSFAMREREWSAGGGHRWEVVVDSEVSSKLNKSSFLINFPSFSTTKNSNERSRKVFTQWQ